VKGHAVADAPRPILAVLIDADNTPARLAGVIFEEIAALGEAAVRRVYGDFTSNHLSGWSKVQAEHGLVPQHSPAHTVGKNSSDISLVIDAMDLLHSGRFGGFVLVSSDSDFTRLASRVREQGLDVYGIGQQKTPESFRKACKRFIFLENLGKEVALPPAAIPAPAAPAVAASPVPDARPRPGTTDEARVMILRAMDAIDPEGDWVGLGALGQYLLRADPDFDPRTYGHKKLSDLIKTVRILETRVDSGNQLTVRRRD
jgi:hypothetical protein